MKNIEISSSFPTSFPLSRPFHPLSVPFPQPPLPPVKEVTNNQYHSGFSAKHTSLFLPTSLPFLPHASPRSGGTSPSVPLQKKARGETARCTPFTRCQQACCDRGDTPKAAVDTRRPSQLPFRANSETSLHTPTFHFPSNAYWKQWDPRADGKSLSFLDEECKQDIDGPKNKWRMKNVISS